jgi:hypothetical protein
MSGQQGPMRQTRMARSNVHILLSLMPYVRYSLALALISNFGLMLSIIFFGSQMQHHPVIK